MDATARAEGRAAREHDAGCDDRVRADGHVGVDVRVRGIFERRAIEHHVATLPFADDAAEFRQIESRVHATKFERIGQPQRFDSKSAAPIDGDQIRQVVLALRIVSRQTVKRFEERLESECVDAAVHFVHAAFIGRGIPFLDNARDRAGRIPHDPSVAARILQLGREDRGGRTGQAVTLEQTVQGFALQQWHVGVKQKKRAFFTAEKRLGCQQGVPRPELRRLHDEFNIRSRRQGGLDVLAVMADDDDGLRGAKGVGGPQHVIDERAAGQGMQHLGHGGFHPRALAGGKNDDVKLAHPVRVGRLVHHRAGCASIIHRLPCRAAKRQPAAADTGEKSAPMGLPVLGSVTPGSPCAASPESTFLEGLSHGGYLGGEKRGDCRDGRLFVEIPILC